MTDDRSAEPRPGVFSTRNLLIVGVVVATAMAVFWLTFGGPLRLGGPVSDEAYVHGAVTPIGVRFDARVASLQVRLGDRVAAGAPLAVLESDHLAARVEAPEARLARARSAYVARGLSVDLDDRAAAAERDLAGASERSAEAAVEADRAARDLARKDLARTEQLVRDRVVSEADLDDARAALRTEQAELARSSARLEAARRRVGLADLELQRSGVRNEDLRARSLAVDVAPANLKAARADLDAATIRAPEDGLVIAISARAGSSVRPNDPILTLWATGRAWVQAWVFEDEVPALRPGAAASIEIEALGGRTFPGVVDEVLVAADGRERTLPGTPISPLLSSRTRFAVVVRFQDGVPADVLPGMTARVRFEPGQ